MQGYIKIYRSILDNPITNKDPEHLAVWLWLLLNAAFKPQKAMFAGKKIELEPGQLITTIPEIAENTKVSERKCRRIINELIFDSQLGRQKSNKNSLFTVTNWNLYQIRGSQKGSQKGSQGAVKGQSRGSQTSRGDTLNNNNSYEECKNVNKRGRARTREGNYHGFKERQYDFNELEKQLINQRL